MWASLKRGILVIQSENSQAGARFEKLANVDKLDFLKMVGAAVAVGVVFSAAAAAMTLLLARSSVANANANAFWQAADNMRNVLADDKASASHLAKSNDVPVVTMPETDLGDVHADAGIAQPAPGNLYISDGCGGEFLAATERDIQISIKDSLVEVQIMQTFVLPGTDGNPAQDARFHAVLPKHALYSSFRVVTRHHDLIGEYANHSELEYGDAAHISRTRQLKTRGLVRVYESPQPLASNALSSDPLIDLLEGESIVVTYRYQVPLDSFDGMKHFSVALADPVYPQDSQQDSYFFPGASNMTARTAATVWVKWIESMDGSANHSVAPRKLLDAPTDVSLEYKRGRITDATWRTTNALPGDQFKLIW